VYVSLKEQAKSGPIAQVILLQALSTWVVYFDNTAGWQQRDSGYLDGVISQLDP
jgi:hypothetical protein